MRFPEKNKSDRKARFAGRSKISHIVDDEVTKERPTLHSQRQGYFRGRTEDKLSGMNHTVWWEKLHPMVKYAIAR